MNILYLSIAICLFSYALFRFYLAITEKHMIWHWQDLRERGRRSAVMGRCWWSIYYDDENRQKYPPSTMKLEWHLLDRYTSPAASFSLCGEERDFSFHVSFWLIGGIWLEFSMTPFRDWLRAHLPGLGYGYQTGIDIYAKTIAFRLAYNEGWGTTDAMKWLPKGVYCYRNVGYDGADVPGYRFAIDFDYLILGTHERDEEFIQVLTGVDIPMEPDNSMGLFYTGTWTEKMEIRWRGNFPWRKQYNHLWSIEIKNPPLRAGKGENSWDLDNTGIRESAYATDTLPDAIWDYVRATYQDRLKYGMPSWYMEMKYGRERTE